MTFIIFIKLNGIVKYILLIYNNLIVIMGNRKIKKKKRYTLLKLHIWLSFLRAQKQLLKLKLSV